MIASLRPLAAVWVAAVWAIVLPLGVAILPIGPAQASSDTDSCLPTSWRLELAVHWPCANVAVLAPGNDTRANLLLLIFDRHGWPSKLAGPVTRPILGWRDLRALVSSRTDPDPADYANGEGSRCRSDAAGAAAFGAAVAAAPGLSPGDRTALLAARVALKPVCAAQAAAAPVAAIPPAIDALSAPAQPFAIYLGGVRSFYAGAFAAAEADFASLEGTADPWLADTAAYMVARTEVNRLQVGAFSPYGDFKGSAAIDQGAATRAATSLDAYLAAHPRGRYDASARGLLRRVDWLAGRTASLAALYAALLALPSSARPMDDVSLVEEIDDKLLPKLDPAMTRDPILLAVLDLKALRKPPIPDPKMVPVPRPDLEAQRDAFVSAPSLYGYLTAAAAFFGDGASAPAIKGLPDDTRRRDGGPVWFSRQFLRGMALDAAGDRNARGFWQELDPGATRPLEEPLVELALALHEERHGEIEDVFATASLVTSPTMRAVLLEDVAGPDLLRAVAHGAGVPARERGIALFTLLYKELTRGRPADFLADLAAVPADAPVAGSVAPEPEPGEADAPPLGVFARGASAGDISCPVLPTTASRLARDPTSARDRLCLAEFIRLNEIGRSLYDRPMPGDLGGTPSLFHGRPYTRDAAYAEVIADGEAPAADRAFALYRAIKCYEPSNTSECGGVDVPKAVRRGWYDTLKREHPASRWAKSLRLWW